MEDPIDRTFEYSGSFENDYLEGCKFQSIPPFQVSRIGIIKSNLLSPSASNPKLFSQKKSSDAAIDALLESPAAIKSTNCESKFKFTKKINISTDDDDEVVGLQIRGWIIPVPMTDILVNSILASSTVSVLNLWNCGLTDAQANTLLQVSNSNIREMFIDQNPGITETLFAGFIGEDSNIKTFSARSNSISDAGAKAIAAALKVNRSLTILNLWDNRIRRDGAEAIADSLKDNQCLLSLSLGKNYMDDAAALAFGKTLSNQLLSLDEVQMRRKVIAEWEKRKELEDRQRKGTVSAPPVKTVGKGKDDPKKAQLAPAKGAKKVEPKSEKVEPKSDKKKPTPEKPKETKSPLKGQRKSSIPEDLDTIPAAFPQEPQPYSEPIYEINGQWYIPGNRTLINLDFSSNEITQIGLNALLEAISIQEITNEIASSSDGLNGLYRLSLHQNKFDLNNAAATTLDNMLKKRNPFYDMEGLLKFEHSETKTEDRLKEPAV